MTRNGSIHYHRRKCRKNKNTNLPKDKVLAVLTFNTNKHGFLSGTFDGGTVYCRAGTENTIGVQVGQPWLCKIFRDMRRDGIYHAIPIYQTESSDSIVSCHHINEVKKDILCEVGLETDLAMEAPYEIVNDIEDESDDESSYGVMDVGVETNASVLDPIPVIPLLDTNLEEDEKPDSGVENKPSDTEYGDLCTSSVIADIDDELGIAGNRMFELNATSAECIYWMEPNTIFSAAFTHSAYNVLISGDGETMVIRADENGRVVPKAGFIRMLDLEKLSLFEGVRKLDFTYDVSSESYVVKLKSKA